MYALISPIQKVIWYKDQTSIVDGEEITTTTHFDIQNGVRIAQVEENTFEVAGDLFWVECNNSVTAHEYYYDTSDNTIKLKSDYTPS